MDMVLNFLNAFILISLAVKTVLDVLYHNFHIDIGGIHKKEEEKRIKNVIDSLYRKEFIGLQHIEKERIRLLVQQLGLTADQFGKITYDIIQFQLAPIKNTEDIKKALLALCRSDAVCIDQTLLLEKRYNQVDYFLDFGNIITDEQVLFKITEMMKCLIQNQLADEKIKNVDKIIIPINGNFLLGYEVAKSLRKSFVNMQEEVHIVRDQYWVGSLCENENVIIINDVLVTAERIEKTIDKLPNGVKVLGAFFLVNRKEWSGKKELEERGLMVHEILELDDNDIIKLKGCDE